MREELEEKLANEFPFMRRGNSYKEQEKSGEIRDLFGAFGCEVGDGWYEVLRGLCHEVAKAYESAGLPVDIVVDRVKEKFGQLRFHYHRVDYDPGIHAIDSLDGRDLQAKPDRSELHQEVTKIVQKWKISSTTVCESCGAAGVLRRDLRWVQTLCQQCYSPRKQKIDEWRLKKEYNDGQRI
ncbi:hypothetical protein [Cohnella endophytica]|nr:hypothetical protein [Cohnella endophytica]